MVNNPPAGMPRVVPHLFYRDVGAATQFLEQVFGFQPRFMMPDAEGLPVHAEMTVPTGGAVMVGRAGAQPEAASPLTLGGITQSLYVFVDDVEAQHARVVAGGGHVTLELSDMFWGDRIFAVQDIENHHWTFAQHLRDVPPEQMRPIGGW